MQTFKKQPQDVLDFDVNLTDWFSTVPGDNISSVAISVELFDDDLTPLVYGALPHPGYTLMGANPVRFKLWLSGGSDGFIYKVTCLISSEQDRVKEMEFKIKVNDL